MKGLIGQTCYSFDGFWTSAIDLGKDTWVWSGTDDAVNEQLWDAGEPTGDGDCAHMRRIRDYRLNDLSCHYSNCYICED